VPLSPTRLPERNSAIGCKVRLHLRYSLLDSSSNEPHVEDSHVEETPRQGRARDWRFHTDGVAALVAFVAGPESSFVNGANLTVNGGTNA